MFERILDMSHEFARRIKAAKDQIIRQLEGFHSVMGNLIQKSMRPNTEANISGHGSTPASSNRSVMITGQLKQRTYPNEQIMFTISNTDTRRRRLLLEYAAHELDIFDVSSRNHAITALKNMPHTFKRDSSNAGTFYTQLRNLRGSKDKCHDLEYFLINHLQSYQHRNT